MLGAILGAAGGIAGKLIGDRSARKWRNRQLSIYKDQLREARANALRYGNEDFSQSAPAQQMIARARELQEQNMQNARGADAVTGGHSVNQAMAQNASANAQMASNLAVQGAARRDAAKQLYDGQANTATNAIAGHYGQTAAEASKAGAEAFKAGMGLVQADIDAAKDGSSWTYDMFGFDIGPKKKTN